MASVESGKAIRSTLWTRITTDATMKTLVGQTVGESKIVMIHRDMAPINPPFPYFVDKMSFGKDFLHGTHTFLLDFWYFDIDRNYVTPDAAIDRLKILLGGSADGRNGWWFTTANSEVSGVIQWFSGGYIPTDNYSVLHYATQWDMRIGAARDITNIVG